MRFFVAQGFRPNDEVGAFKGFVVVEAESLSLWDFFSFHRERGWAIATVLDHEGGGWDGRVVAGFESEFEGVGAGGFHGEHVCALGFFVGNACETGPREGHRRGGVP